MKLSEMLIEQSEFWCPDVPCTAHLLHVESNHHMYVEYPAHVDLPIDWNSYLCLFEAEIQKDIESSNEQAKRAQNYINKRFVRDMTTKA